MSEIAEVIKSIDGMPAVAILCVGLGVGFRTAVGAVKLVKDMFNGKNSGVLFQDVVKHCGSQQAVIKKDMDDKCTAHGEEIDKKFERGSERFDKLNEEIQKNRIELGETIHSVHVDIIKEIANIKGS